MMKTYGKLREAIRREFKTLDRFACAMCISESALSLKLNGKAGWKQAEIENACKLLGIHMAEVGEYFFYE